MDLNLFNNRKIDNDSLNKNNNIINIFIEELKNALRNTMNEGTSIYEKNNVLEEYNLYEKKKIFLDNKTKWGNDLAWVMDDKSVCLSEHGDGGPYAIAEINLPEDARVGEVYEKVDGQYIYNSEITEEINKIIK